MKIEEYQKIALTTITDDHNYGDISPQTMEVVLGLVGESGEVAEKFKKIIRDKDGKLTEEDKAEIAKELGDVLWYVTAVAYRIGTDLESVAKSNNDKLMSRLKRKQLSGSGDNR